MNNAKRFLAFFLTLALCVSMLAACSKKDESSAAEAASEAVSEATEEVKEDVSEAAEEVEEEVSVEKLLQSQEEENLEEIGFNNKSEARIMIEKFVDENPDAAAALLRNWLNEDWG